MKIIPVFLPYAGCKHRCVFCDQLGATGVSKRPTPGDIEKLVREYLKTASEYELAFYGGTFTALSEDLQESYLNVIKPYLGKFIKRVRISTRPDEIDEEEAAFLRERGVSVVEIGAQSMFDDVLEKSARGHTAKDVMRAVRILKSMNFTVGVHLMAGLPGSSFYKDVRSAEIVADMGVELARVHPTLVFRGTELERMMESGSYKPLDIEEGVIRTAEMVMALEAGGVKVIRIGLYVPPSLVSNVVAGPYHPSFGELVRCEIVFRISSELGIDEIEYDERHESWIRGHGNAIRLKALGIELKKGTKLRFGSMSYSDAVRRYVRGRRDGSGV